MPLIQRVRFRRNVLDELYRMDIIGGRDEVDAAHLAQPILQYCNSPFESDGTGYYYVPLRPFVWNADVLLVFHVQCHDGAADVFDVESAER